MSTTNHTPGPWEDDGYRIRSQPEAEYPNGRIIVEYKHTADFNGHDAPLIAAAPDLLDALVGIFAELDDGDGAPGHCHSVPGVWDSDNRPGLAGKPCEWCRHWETARTAIAKATGSPAPVAQPKADDR